MSIRGKTDVAADRQYRHVGAGMVSASAAVRQPVGPVLPANGRTEVRQRDSRLRAGRHRSAGQSAVFGALVILNWLGGTGPTDARQLRMAAGEFAQVLLRVL